MPIFTDRKMLIVARGHPLDKGRVGWKELEPYPQIIIETGRAERAMLANKFDEEPAFGVEVDAFRRARVRLERNTIAPPRSREFIQTLRDNDP